jgi:hypothetical protein
MEVAALVISIVALTLALLSFLWTIGWSIYTHRKTTRPQVQVEGRFSVLGTEPVMRTYGFIVVNDGLVPATISSASVEVEGADNFFAFVRFAMQSGGELPAVLGPGASWTGFVLADELRNGVAEIAGDLEPPWRYRLHVGGPGSRDYASDWYTMAPGA